MQWGATDQFGNLYIGVSEAQSVEELRPDLSSMIEELRARVDGPFRLTIDLEYNEINGPDPERVSHILQVSFLSSQEPTELFDKISSSVTALCAELGIEGVEVQLANP